ncbi:MAG: hypothetical protein ABFC24_13095 [Methanoregulaceae archaeon]
MHSISAIFDRWLGLCRKAPVIRASQADIDNPPEPSHEGSPDGGAGGPGTIRRGIGAARSGVKTLIRNPQLFWFPLLAGLVLAGNLIGQSLLFLIRCNREPNGIAGYGLPLVIEISTVFCLVFLLAGLVLSISSRKGGAVSFFHGLATAGKYLRPLALWSIVVGLAGTLLFIAGMSMSSWASPPFDIFGNLEVFLSHVLAQFPFNWALDPNFFLGNPPGEHPPTLLEEMGFPGPTVYTLIFSAINILLFILTLFVVPLIVLEGKSLKEAVLGSFALTRKVRGEVVVCVLGLGTLVFAALLTFLPFRFTGFTQVSIVDGGAMLISYSRPGAEWIVAAFLYVLALSGLVVVIATVGGIATLILYTVAKTGKVPGSAETEPFP